MKRIYLYIIIVVLVVGTAGYFYLSNSNGKDIKYRTDKVTRGDIVVLVRATGTINPVQTVQVGSQVSGILAKIFADFNSEVTKGQIIAQIDTTFLAASVKEAEANLEQNLAQKNQAERDFSRTSELFKRNLVAQADLDVAKTKYESTSAQLKQSQAALDRARVNLRYAIIRAPIDGVVISRDVDVGQTVAASLQAPQLFRIANDLKRMQVEASVDEADIGQVKMGEDVSFTVDAYPEEQFHGSVSQIRLAPVTVQNVVTYTVIIDVPNPDLKLRPGMTATVSILVDRRDNVLRIPAIALRFQPPSDVLEKIATQNSGAKGNPPDSVQVRRGGQQRGDRMRGQEAGGGGERRMTSSRSEGGGGWHKKQSKVWALDENKNLRPVLITTGLNDNRYVEVSSGDLKEGDDVVLSAMGPETAANTSMQSNPFQTRMPGGGGGGRGR